MIYKTRTSMTGTEYWDTEEKRTLFVPRGLKPDFEVSEDPHKVVTPESQAVELKKEQESEPEQINPFLAMTLKEMKSYAEEHEIDIPDDITKHDDVANYLDNYNA